MITVEGPVQLAHDTAANWTANNRVLLAGEKGIETDTGREKTGDGTTTWNALPYFGESGGGGGGDHPDSDHATLATTTSVTTAITTHEAASNPHAAYALDTDLSTHAAATDPHTGYRLESAPIAAADVAADIATQAELDAHINDTTAAHAASSIAFTPAGTIAATTVQAAIEEVAAEASGGSAFTPPLSTRLRTWVRPEELIDYANNETVGLWTDAGPNNLSPAQATSTLRPICKINVLNTYPVVEFDGVDDYLATPAFAGSSPLQPLTAIAVVKYLTNTERIFDGITVNKLFYGHNGSGGWNLYAGTGPIVTAFLWDTAWHIHVVIANGASSKIYVDGGAAKVTGNAGTNGLDGLTIGAGGAGGQPGNIQVSELVISPTALTLAQINTWGSHLGTKYGLTWTTAT